MTEKLKDYLVFVVVLIFFVVVFVGISRSCSNPTYTYGKMICFDNSLGGYEYEYRHSTWNDQLLLDERWQNIQRIPESCIITTEERGN